MALHIDDTDRFAAQDGVSHTKRAKFSNRSLVHRGEVGDILLSKTEMHSQALGTKGWIWQQGRKSAFLDCQAVALSRGKAAFSERAKGQDSNIIAAAPKHSTS